MDVIAPDPTVPARVTFAPLKVAAVVGVEPDLITNSPLEFVKLAKVVPHLLILHQHHQRLI